MIKKVLSFVSLYLAIMAVSFAQTSTVTGKIIDSNGEPLIGANVIVKGTTVGTVSDVDGNYNLTGVPTGPQVLVSSFIGFNSEEKSIDSKTDEILTINFKLIEDITTLDELVVVGYGTQKTKEVTGAVTSVKAEDFNNGNIEDPIQLIQGKVAGLSISRPGGDPNQDFNIRLRGLSTFGANTQPLVVVDGVQGVSLKSVDPNDIATYDVLKDASAAAIYGTKGASGVIIITTKKGKKGTEDKPVNVEFSSSLTSTSIAKKLDVLSKEDYLTFPGAVDYGSETNWMDAISRKGLSQTYNIAAGGATKNSSYRMAFNYRQGQGVVLKTGFDQLNGRVNLTQSALNDMLTLDFNMSTSVRNEEYSPKEALGFAVKYNPTAPIYDDTSAYGQEWGGYFQRNAYAFYNPYAAIEQNVNKGKKTSIIGSMKATFEPIKGLKFSEFYSQDHRTEDYGQYWSKNSYFTPFNLGHKGAAKKENKIFYDQMFESTLSYEKSIDLFKGSLLAGYSWQQSLNQGFWAYAEDFLTDGFLDNNLGAGVSSDLANSSQMDSWKNKSTLIGTFARGTFSYDETYFLLLNYRHDGSSMFGANNKWGNFYGVSGGIDISKFINIESIDRIKIRGGVGSTGNLPPEPYLAQDLWSPAAEKFYYEGQYIQAYAPVRNTNPDLKWEVKKETNIGLDYAFFNYRLTGTVDYFKSTSSDLMLNFRVPVPPNKAEYMWLNVGQLSNSGLEFAVSYNVLKAGDFSWTTDLNFTKYIRTKLDKITSNKISSTGQIELGELGAPNLVGVKPIILNEGEPVGQIYAYVYKDSVGIDPNSGESIHYWNYEIDSTGNLLKAVAGNGLPTFQIGWGNTFTYKNFDLNFFFRGVFGHSLINTNNARYADPVTIAIQNGMTQALDYKNYQGKMEFSNLSIEKADFVTLDNFAIGYTLNLPESKYVSKVRASVSGQNLFTITKYTGTSPEPRFGDSGDNNNPLAPGIDRGDTYFRTRSFTFGVNVTF